MTEVPKSDSAQPSADAVQPKNPLHGITLAVMLEALVDHYGWEGLGDRIDIRCFTYDPSISSSLRFLRKTQWARDKVERLYLRTFRTPSRKRPSGLAPPDGQMEG